jgi:hypothetical protein
MINKTHLFSSTQDHLRTPLSPMGGVGMKLNLPFDDPQKRQISKTDFTFKMNYGATIDMCTKTTAAITRTN